MNDPDRDLIEQSSAGSKAAFGKLVEKHYEMVYAVAYGILGNREAALDAAQEAFLKAFREIKEFKGQAKFKTWLYRIVVNAAIDMCRRKRPEEPLEEGALFEAKIRSPREEASREEMRSLVRKALDFLNPEHRTVLILREWHEMSYEEIAETLQIEMGTVMSRLFYARKKLGEIIGLELKGSEP